MTQPFSQLGLSAPLVAALEAAGFSTPTEIQARAIGPQLAGRDILGIAQTGSGKTAAFTLPIIEGIAALQGRPAPGTTRALILAPTRELAVQIEQVFRSFAPRRLSSVLVLGGMSRHAQVQAVARGVDIVIATPGRLLDLVRDRKLRLNETRWLVLDEADRMLDMGFIRPVTEIANAIGPARRTALFSATMAPEVAKLAAALLDNPERVEASPPATTVVSIAQSVLMAPTATKRQVLNALLADADLRKVLVFARTKHGADRVVKNLGLDGHGAAAIHGNKAQNARQAALRAFASGANRILVATDIAARGIDIADISHVINYELPDDPETYVHRIGRTGRNGAAGIAITLCDPGERAKLRDVERIIRQRLPVAGGGDVGPDNGGSDDLDAKARPPRAPRQTAGRPAQARAAGRPEGKGAGRSDSTARRPEPAAAKTSSRRAAEPTPQPWWTRETGSAAPRGSEARVKPRWSKRQKDARRATASV